MKRKWRIWRILFPLSALAGAINAVMFRDTISIMCLGVSAVLFASSTAMLLGIINNYLERGDR